MRTCTQGPIWTGLWGLAIGAALYLYWYGTAALDPANIGWMSRGDPATYFLTWHFFRFEPWTFPLGLVRNYGEGLGTSVIVADALPLVAIALKPFSAWLPERFQYFGIWVFACVVLNAVTSYALLARLTANPFARVVGTALLTTVPFAVLRGTWHMSLMAHWQVLLAVILYLAPARRKTWVAWGALLVASGLTTVYLFAIVGAVWVAALARAAWFDAPRTPGRLIAGVALATIGASAFFFWVAGMFSISGHAGIGGYGYNQLDLLSFFDSRGMTRLHPGFAKGLDSGIEQFQYLGLGATLAVALAAALWLGRPSALPRHWVPLVVVAVLLLVFAISYRVTFAGHVLFEVPMPQALHDLAAILRSSARMAWLFGYLMLAWAIATIANRLPAALAGTVLLVMLYVGGIDASTLRPQTLGAANFKATPVAEQQAALVAALPAQYQRISWVPRFHLMTDNIHEVWGFGVCAVPRGMAMNIAYVARFDPAEYQLSQQRGVEAALHGPIDAATAYVTPNPALAASLLRVGGPGTVQGKLGADFVTLPRLATVTPQLSLPQLAAVGVEAAPPFVESEFGSATPGRYYLGAGW